jgi:hypothetical protein
MKASLHRLREAEPSSDPGCVPTSSRSVDGLEGVRVDLLSDLLAEPHGLNVGGAEVEPLIDAGVDGVPLLPSLSPARIAVIGRQNPQ